MSEIRSAGPRAGRRAEFANVAELAAVLPPSSWVLIGGLMVHAHADLAGLVHPRPTDDVDVVVEVQVMSYPRAAAALEAIGYRRREPLDRRTPFHRFERTRCGESGRGGDVVDLMAPEGSAVRFAGRDVIRVPGSRSALRRTVSYPLGDGAEPSASVVDGPVRIPDLSSAISLKGAALRTPSANPVRHLQDAVTLFACVDRSTVDLSKSMRQHANHLINALDSVEAWSFADPHTRRKAVRAIRTVRPDWRIPPFLLPQRP